MLLKRIDDRTLNRVIMVTAVFLVLLVAGFGYYYYVDRYSQTSTPIVDQEIDHIRKAVQADPSNLDARVAFVVYLLEKNQVDEAIKEGEGVLAVQPDHQGALFATGSAYLAKKNDDKVIEYFDKIVQANKDAEYASLNRNLGIVQYNLGNVYIRRKQYDKAEEAFKGALTVDRADADSYYGLGQAFAGEEKYDMAIEAFRYALRFDPEYSPFYEGLRDAYTKKDMPDQAAYAGAMVLYGKGDYGKAVDQLLNVTKAVPDFAEAYRALGMSYEKAGKKDEAANAYKRALELDGSDQASAQGYGRVTTGTTSSGAH